MADCILSVRVNSLRCKSASFGFGSNVSMWLGPPSIIRKMHAFALAVACGPAARFSSAASSAVHDEPHESRPRQGSGFRPSPDPLWGRLARFSDPYHQRIVLTSHVLHGGI